MKEIRLLIYQKIAYLDQEELSALLIAFLCCFSNLSSDCLPAFTFWFSFSPFGFLLISLKVKGMFNYLT